jgi:hypothetical protein
VQVEKSKAKTKRADIFKRAESYLKEYKTQEAAHVQARRQARAGSSAIHT